MCARRIPIWLFRRGGYYPPVLLVSRPSVGAGPRPARWGKSGNGNWGMFRPRASEFYTAETFCFGGVKFTKEPSKGRGISISLSPLKSSLLKTTNLVLASSRSLALPGGQGSFLSLLVLSQRKPLRWASFGAPYLRPPIGCTPQGMHPAPFFVLAHRFGTLFS